ncbi:hypothetical protein BJ508DRAFT_313317 [Ascobolus immersus RN42]|uniref:Uncharacterized protein n=1 Tax=Ascobolus immersus RN42 TaxID=1160509 RepID=A0A3N4HL47_ASCIM|nr:hypothetical protein BJ508DRAFT_313317 [Ascobolus immersus RN42]
MQLPRTKRARLVKDSDAAATPETKDDAQKREGKKGWWCCLSCAKIKKTGEYPFLHSRTSRRDLIYCMDCARKYFDFSLAHERRYAGARNEDAAMEGGTTGLEEDDSDDWEECSPVASEVDGPTGLEEDGTVDSQEDGTVELEEDYPADLEEDGPVRLEEDDSGGFGEVLEGELKTFGEE